MVTYEVDDNQRLQCDLSTMRLVTNLFQYKFKTWMDNIYKELDN